MTKIIVPIALVVAGFAACAGANDDPPTSDPPAVSAPADDADIAQLAARMTWAQATRDDRESYCLSIEILGAEWTAQQIELGMSADTPWSERRELSSAFIDVLREEC